MKKYCVVATDRATNKREDITGELPSLDEANAANIHMQSSRWWKKSHKYFKIAGYPFKTKGK